MELEDIKIGNKAIAEFMGAKTPQGGYHYGSVVTWHPEDLKFDRDWNWIMPVIDRIQQDTVTVDGRGEVNFIVTIEPKYCVISVGGEEPVVEIQFDEYDQLGLVYSAAAKFAEWWLDR